MVGWNQVGEIAFAVGWFLDSWRQDTEIERLSKRVKKAEEILILYGELNTSRRKTVALQKVVNA